MANDNLFQQAKDAVNNFMTSNPNEQDKQAAKNAIQAAYTNCTPEEKQHLQQLEQQLEQNQQLS
ncbi:DUF3813 domain-containing protein [Cerasibacillus terrae]|uniref:DUF3813 domain-containing protein n=1 Tax=Cerasibacillus terrae TaxID=2498845 RepID=A0A5C8NSB6_9BACI|nr:DUF3813 domain-containing protein [Cerasibacillus terrae]TXL64026.1 DUF3813 domain-containing protein [Cerasibacillus terrae]